MEAKLFIEEANPDIATIVLLTMSDPENETTATIVPLTVTRQGTLTEHIEKAVGLRIIWLFGDNKRMDSG
jgi:hypothetical protein